MNLIVHRGAHEIGGTCIELTSGDFHLVLDLGMPLVNPDGTPFELPRGANRDSLKASGWLPNIPQVFEKGAGNAAVVLTHGHADHYGFSGYCEAGIPVYATEGTRVLMRMTEIFQKTVPMPVVEILPKRVPFQIGPFSITALPVPHSAPDAVALLIEAEGRRIFYSGDLRAGGRTAPLFERLVQDPPANVDLMLLEGTTMGGEPRPATTEEQIEESLVEMINQATNLTMVFCSSQNLDRMVTVFRAARRAKATLVMDLNHAFVLHSLQCLSDRIPQYHWDGVRVKYWPAHAKALAEAGHREFLFQANHRKIRNPEIAASPEKFVLLAKSNRFLNFTFRHLHSLEGLTCVWSMWREYWKRDRYLRPFCETHQVEPEFLHAGGHASPKDLQRLVSAIRPRKVIPVHTFHPECFPNWFPETRFLPDGEEACLDESFFQQ